MMRWAYIAFLVCGTASALPRYYVEATSDSGLVYESPDVATFPLSLMPAGFWANYAGGIQVTDSTGVTEYAAQIINIDTGGETGRVSWDATFSTSSDDTWRIYYGPTLTAMPSEGSTYGAENVYGDFVSVHHLTETGGTTAYDATANDNDSTNIYGSMTGADNIAGPTSDWAALDFDGDDYILCLNSATGFDRADMTISMWIYKDSTTYGYFWGAGKSVSIGDRQIRLYEENLNSSYFYPNDYRMFSTTEGKWRYSTSPPAASAWIKLDITYDGSSTGNVPTVYIDGVAMAAPSVLSSPTGTYVTTDVDTFAIGSIIDGSAPFTGRIAEVQNRGAAESANYVATTYAMESDAGFWMVGAEVDTGGGSSGHPWFYRSR